MKTFTTKLIAVSTALCLVSANVAVAKSGGNNGNKSGSSSFKFGGGNSISRTSNGSSSLSTLSRLSSGNTSSGGSNKFSGISKVNVSNKLNGGNQINNAKKLNGDNHDHTALKLGLIGLGVALHNANNNNGNGNGNCNSNNNNNGNCNNNNNNNGNCNNGNGGLGGVDVNGDGIPDGNGVPVTDNFVNLGRSFEPFHSSYVTQPGDSVYEVALKEYGSSIPARFIAQFNNFPTDTALTVGQVLQLPSIGPNGQLSVSRAPVAESLQGTPTSTPVASLGTTPDTTSTSAKFVSSTTPVVEAPRPTVPAGSTLLVDGQTFGEKQGTARLRVSGLSLPIEVVEWNTSSVKIHLPSVELTSATKADIEVVRADGTLASKTGIELGAPSPVASTN